MVSRPSSASELSSEGASAGSGPASIKPRMSSSSSWSMLMLSDEMRLVGALCAPLLFALNGKRLRPLGDERVEPPPVLKRLPMIGVEPRDPRDLLQLKRSLAFGVERAEPPAPAPAPPAHEWHVDDGLGREGAAHTVMVTEPPGSVNLSCGAERERGAEQSAERTAMDMDAHWPIGRGAGEGGDGGEVSRGSAEHSDGPAQWPERRAQPHTPNTAAAPTAARSGWREREAGCTGCASPRG
mmetsp:Transcript_19869/g.51296  ORF Transcript_19869/g.51296 Transcript_19869/m.51296 type:complete len:240 (+) Transcript_19869:55-774(+)